MLLVQLVCAIITWRLNILPLARPLSLLNVIQDSMLKMTHISGKITVSINGSSDRHLTGEERVITKWHTPKQAGPGTSFYGCFESAPMIDTIWSSFGLISEGWDHAKFLQG